MQIAAAVASEVRPAVVRPAVGRPAQYCRPTCTSIVPILNICI